MPTAPLYTYLGPVALASRLRALTDRLSTENARLYRLYGVPLHPHHFPVFTALTRNPEASASELAGDVGQSHVAVGKTLCALERAGLVARQPDPRDARRRRIALTPAGERAARNLQPQLADVATAVDEALGEIDADLWAALDDLERVLDDRGLEARTRAIRRARAEITITPFAPHHAAAFRDLNTAWIERFFTLEPEDRRLLDDPAGAILQPGGYIAMATLVPRHDPQAPPEPVGTCALLPLPDDPDYPFELVKMAVAPHAQGLGIGEALGRHVLAKAVELGARTVYLETNPVLAAAVGLYRKLGFREVSGHASPFARCGLQMAWSHATHPSDS